MDDERGKTGALQRGGRPFRQLLDMRPMQREKVHVGVC
jgi:hypothetical protein